MIQRIRHLPPRLHRQRRRTRRFDHGEPISRIDTRPMVFVAMFLVVLFIAPAAQTREHALLIDLPQNWGNFSIDQEPMAPYLTVRITTEGEILLEGITLDLDRLAAKIRSSGIPEPLIAFEPDGDAPYGTVALAMNEISKAGVARNSICFIGNENFRRFERISYYQATTVIEDEQQEWRRTDPDFLAPDPCAQFYVQYEVY